MSTALAKKRLDLIFNLIFFRLKLIKLKSFVLPDGPYYEMVKSNFERAGGADRGDRRLGRLDISRWCRLIKIPLKQSASSPFGSLTRVPDLSQVFQATKVNLSKPSPQ